MNCLKRGNTAKTMIKYKTWAKMYKALHKYDTYIVLFTPLYFFLIDMLFDLGITYTLWFYIAYGVILAFNSLTYIAYVHYDKLSRTSYEMCYINIISKFH